MRLTLLSTPGSQDVYLLRNFALEQKNIRLSDCLVPRLIESVTVGHIGGPVYDNGVLSVVLAHYECHSCVLVLNFL